MRDWLTVADVLAIHADQIERYGGAAGLRDDAIFVARAFLTKQGAIGSFGEHVTFLHDDTAAVWLQRWEE